MEAILLWCRTYMDVLFGIFGGAILHVIFNISKWGRELFLSTLAGVVSALLLFQLISEKLDLVAYDYVVGAIVTAMGTSTFILIFEVVQRVAKAKLNKLFGGDTDDRIH